MSSLVIGIVPARYGSTRWPGKVLAPVEGKALLAWAWDTITRAELVDRALVAADDERVAAWAERNGIPVVLTSTGHRNGTERCAEIASRVPGGIYVNVQADQKGLEPRLVDRLVHELRGHPSWQMATAATRIGLAEARKNPDSVLVATHGNGLAGEFRRGGGSARGERVLRHLGVYAYRRAPLLQYAEAPPSEQELRLDLEQCRAAALGWSIGLIRIRSRATSHDRQVKGESGADS